VSDEGASPGGASEPLQFDKVEFATAAQARSCASCTAAITEQYFEAAGQILCPACADRVGGKAAGKGAFLRALGYGGAVALLGTLVWYAIIKIADMQLGLIAVFVGLGVGLAVRKGARGRGGWAYQALAVFLTYASITTSYVPFVISGISEGAKQEQSKAAEQPTTEVAKPPEEPMPAALALVLFVGLVWGIAFAAPFLGGTDNLIGLAIIAFALYEAWKLNKRVPLTGPFKLAPEPPIVAT